RAQERDGQDQIRERGELPEEPAQPPQPGMAGDIGDARGLARRATARHTRQQQHRHRDHRRSVHDEREEQRALERTGGCSPGHALSSFVCSSTVSLTRTALPRLLRLLPCRGSGGPPPAASVPVKIQVAEDVAVDDTTEYVATLKSRASTAVMPQVEGLITE